MDNEEKNEEKREVTEVEVIEILSKEGIPDVTIAEMLDIPESNIRAYSIDNGMELVEETGLVGRIKRHLTRNRNLYIGFGVGVLVTAVGGAIFTNTAQGKSVVNKIVGVSWKPIVNATTIFVEAPERRGHPGYIVRCIDTGEVFPSQGRAAELLNLNPSRLSEHLNGNRGVVNGLKFERLGEAMAPSHI